jgi:hypothetical protein
MAWLQIVNTISINAASSALWSVVHPFVDAPGLIRIETIGATYWMYGAMPTPWCSPDGDLTSLMSRKHCLVPSAPVGALVGKIGGSSAGTGDGTTFAVGRTCVVKVPDGGGPLYLAINDEPSGMWNNWGYHAVNVFFETLADPKEPSEGAAPPTTSQQSDEP